MDYLSLEPFVPSGADFDSAKSFFVELGFNLDWEVDGYAGFENNGCRFILQRYDQREFAENFMLSVRIPNAEAFRQTVLDKKLPEKYGIKISALIQQPYGIEVNIIDKAGVCWHFVQ